MVYLQSAGDLVADVVFAVGSLGVVRHDASGGDFGQLEVTFSFVPDTGELEVENVEKVLEACR